MTMNMMTRSLMTLAAAALVVPAVSAHAATKPTVVVMHRNIANVQDESNWKELALGLSSDGFRVVSIAMAPEETTETASANVVKFLNTAGYNERVLLVGTASASETISTIAQQEPTKVAAVVYISAGDAVPAFGPRSVTVPSALTGAVPAFQVKVTSEKHMTASTEGNMTTFKVREEGHSTLGRTADMVSMIEQVNDMAKKTVVAHPVLGTK